MNRREAVALLAGSLLAATLLEGGARAGAIAATVDVLAKLPLRLEDLSSEDRFYALSKILTGHIDLSRGASDKLYPYFAEEPWGPDNQDRTLGTLVAALRRPDQRLVAADVFPKLDPDERWFAGHVLTTWYLGIYYHERLIHRVLYEEALQWSAVAGMVPVQGMSGEPFGFWVDPPAMGA